MKQTKSYRSRQKILSAFALTTALLAASCGGSTTDAGGTTEPAPVEEDSGQDTTLDDQGSPEAGFPSTEVLGLADGETFAFSEAVADVDTPVLLWFYFPH